MNFMSHHDCNVSTFTSLAPLFKIYLFYFIAGLLALAETLWILSRTNLRGSLRDLQPSYGLLAYLHTSLLACLCIVLLVDSDGITWHGIAYLR
jgi:hypothetical protein